ncbi:MAG: patatin-like phospholipase family protein [Acholeplasmataceae bacterium]
MKLGLCLTGGGARGAYQIGALMALKELDILKNVAAYSGTSIGAANAALVASTSVEKARDVWFSIPEENMKKQENLIRRFTKERLLAIDQGIYKMDLFEDIITSNVDFDNLHDKDVFVTVAQGGNIEDSVFQLLLTSYRHFIKKERQAIYLPLKELSREDASKGIIASCSIPIVFPAVEYHEKKYYDGGVVDNIPVQPLVDHGCDEIIIIHLNRTFFFRTDRFEGVRFHEIKHKKGLGRVLDFSMAHTEKIYALGYEDTMEYYQNLRSESG